MPNVRAAGVAGPAGLEQRPGDAADAAAGTSYGQRQYGQAPVRSARIRSALWRAAAAVGGGGGGSFLGTAAAAAAGVVGGSLLLNSIRGMMGGGGSHQAFADAGRLGGTEDRPWSDQSSSDLARDAGINDIGSSGGRGDTDHGSRAGLFDQASNDDDDADRRRSTDSTTMSAATTATAITRERRSIGRQRPAQRRRP